jgi:hypothetical protein
MRIRERQLVDLQDATGNLVNVHQGAEQLHPWHMRTRAGREEGQEKWVGRTDEDVRRSLSGAGAQQRRGE